MNAAMQAFLKMLQTLKAMVTDNLARFTVIPAFEDTYTEVTDIQTQLEALKLIAAENTKGDTGAALAVRAELTAATMLVLLPVLALAGKLNNVQLKTLMNIKPYKLDAMSQVLFVSTCQNIYAAAVEVRVAAAAYGLTQARLDDMTALIASYQALVPEIRQQGGEINTSKSDIERLANEAEAILKEQLDPMVEGLAPTDPTAVALWRSARHIVKPSSTPTQLKVKVFTLEGETFVPLADIPFLAVNGKEYTLVTDDLGEALKKPIPFGMYDLKCIVPGYLPFQQKNFKMVRGRINKVEVVLEREP